MDMTQDDLTWASAALARLLRRCFDVVADELEQMARELRGAK